MDYVERLKMMKIIDNEGKYPIVTRNVQFTESDEDILVSFDLYNT